MTKRKYTVTAKVLEANRWKLALARLVEPAIRFRVSERRRTACRANLVKARAVLRAASLTPDGLSKLENGDRKFEISNLKSENENSKAEIGDLKIETGRAKIRNHKSEITNHKWLDSPAYGTRLTRGLCAVSLRRSARLMGESAEGFDRHVARFLQALGPRDEPEHNLARGMAETVWRRLRVFRGQAHWERTRLVWVLRQACVGTIENEGWTPAELGSQLESKIQDLFSSDEGLDEAADKLNARLERLTRLWIQRRDGKPRLFQYSTAPGARDARLLDRPAGVMGNPFLHPSATEARLAGRAEDELAAFPKMWRSSKFETRKSKLEDPYLTGAKCRNWKTAGDWPSALDGESFNLDTSEKLGELWEQTLEAIADRGHMRQDNTISRHTQTDSSLLPDSRFQIRDLRSPIENRQSSIVNALWRRLNFYRDLAEREAGEVERLLDAKIAGRMGEDFLARLGALPPGASFQAGEDGETAAFLVELVLLLNRATIGATPTSTLQANAALDDEMHQELGARFGRSGGLEGLESVYPSVTQAESERRRAEVEAQAANAGETAARQRRMEQEIRGLEWSVRFFAGLGAGLVKTEV